MNVNAKLNLNKHPKDCKNLSLVNAYNMKVTDDESSLTNEESIKENSYIRNYLTGYYGNQITYKIVGIISCNNEIVIIVKPSNTDVNSDIFRYQEPVNDNIESMYPAYGGKDSDNRFSYSGGKIKGVFTYNVENSLIVAITEYDVIGLKIPLRTINLGNSKDTTVYNDKDLSNSKLSLSPEVRLPNVSNLQYVSGSAYKGWYYIFIRYKVNSVDYTQWYSIGTPVYVDTLEQFQIIRFCFNRDTKFDDSNLTKLVMPNMPFEGYGAGCSDYFSNTSDIAKETFKVDLNFNADNKYDKYQVGVICASKTYTKAFRTADIFSNSITQQYTLDNKSLIEYNVTDFTTDNFNYFNVKNLANYQNRLYVTNYLEDNANTNIDQSKIDAINIGLSKGTVSDYGLVYDTTLITEAVGVNQYDTYNFITIPLHIYLNMSEETIITISAPSYPTKTARLGQFYIIANNNKTPEFAYIQLRESGVGGAIVKTDYGRAPNQTVLYITIPTTDSTADTKLFIDTNKIAINGGMRYINTNISFNERKRESTLIPGEIYSFHIHFTNKYNAATNGHKLTNNTIWTTEDDPNVEIIPIPFSTKVVDEPTTYYAASLVDDNVATYDFSIYNQYVINIENIKFYKDISIINNKPVLSNRINVADEEFITKSFVENFSSYANSKFIDTKWYQVSYGTDAAFFNLFINNNGDRLFKVPTCESFILDWDGFPNELNDFRTRQLHTLLRISIDNIEIPEGYDGYYISYEKFESQRRVTGLLTRNDFRTQNYISIGNSYTRLGTANNSKSDKMYFYSSGYDISDTIKLDYNIMRIEAINCFKKDDIPEWDYLQRNKSFGFVHDMNKPQIESYGADVQKTYAMPDYKIVVGDSAVDNRIGLGTALQIEDAYNLFSSYDDVQAFSSNPINLYRVTLINNTRDIYMSNNKTLVRLTDVYYREEANPIDYKYTTGYIASGYNGHYTYDGIPIYENAGVTYNTTNGQVRRVMYNTDYYSTGVPDVAPHTYQNDIPFLAYVQLPICMDNFLESKSFKNAPKNVVYLMVSGEGITNRYATGSMVTPANSIDLFENTQGAADDFNPKTYTNFRNDLVSVEQYDKTIRRSNVIQDESRINGWRSFPVEGYKNITENKGKITNIVGIGTIFLIHTEHSLFMFNIDSTLRTQDKDIQLVQPDAFEVAYKEVFTSDKGFGGLQDDKSFVIDQFGYIFYSNDTNRIYQFDNNQLDNIDEDILQWLSKYKPFNVRMANDKRNHRILIKFDYNINEVTKHTVVSYNYKTKAFISQHNYYFDEAFNTKVNLYLQCDNTHVGCSLHQVQYNKFPYGQFDNVLGNIGTSTIKESKISVIVNNDYDTVKFLEYITYKLTKYKDDTALDFTNLPVEEYIEPYAADRLAVYNNMINTGLLDISVDTENDKNIFGNFDKPYWELGVWNYSYLRNKISELDNGLSATNMSRLFGNYFIIEFTFNNADGRRIDFEELNYRITE